MILLDGEALSGPHYSQERGKRLPLWGKGQEAQAWGPEGTQGGRRSLPGPVLEAGDSQHSFPPNNKSPFAAPPALYTRNRGRKWLKQGWVQEWEGVLPSQFGTLCKRKSKARWACPGRTRGRVWRSRTRERRWQSRSRTGQTGRTLCEIRPRRSRAWKTQKQKGLNLEDPCRPGGKTRSLDCRQTKENFAGAASAVLLVGKKISTLRSDLPLLQGLEPKHLVAREECL